jgi:hypothetical protein
MDSGWIAAAHTGVNGYKFTDVGTPGPNLLCCGSHAGLDGIEAGWLLPCETEGRV